jgi:PII-like signaling protein
MWQKMLDLTVRMRKNDEVGGKRLQELLMSLLQKAGVAGATIWTGVDGFGKRGRSKIHWEGVQVNMPLIIEVIDEPSKIELLLPGVKRIVGDDGIVTIQEVNVV